MKSKKRRTEGKARRRGGSEKQEEDGVESRKKAGRKRGHASNVGCRALFLSLL